jgi:ABC-type sulfate transport system permease subunit
MLVFMMLPLVFLPLLSIFIFGTSSGLTKFWAALTTSEAVFALKLFNGNQLLGDSLQCAFWIVRLLRAFEAQLLGTQCTDCYHFSPDRESHCRCRFALLLLWGPYGTLGRFLAPHGSKSCLRQ